MARPEPARGASSVVAPVLPAVYTLRDVPEVAAYLQRKPGVIRDLTEIAEAIMRYFPDKSAVLDVLEDPEETMTTLCVGIQAGRDAARANAQLDRFDREWWFERSGGMDIDLCVDVEYR